MPSLYSPDETIINIVAPTWAGVQNGRMSTGLAGPIPRFPHRVHRIHPERRFRQERIDHRRKCTLIVGRGENSSLLPFPPSDCFTHIFHVF